jgi:hypothetical protein
LHLPGLYIGSKKCSSHSSPGREIMKFIKGLIWWVIAVTFTAIFISLGLSWISAGYDFVPNPRNVLLAILASGTLIWWVLPRVWSWWRWRQEFPIRPFLSAMAAIVIFGATDVCAETIHAGTLTPPDKWLMVRNPFAPTGTEVWIVIGVFVAIGLAWIAIFRFIRNRDDRAPNAM